MKKSKTGLILLFIIFILASSSAYSISSNTSTIITTPKFTSLVDEPGHSDSFLITITNNASFEREYRIDAPSASVLGDYYFTPNDTFYISPNETAYVFLNVDFGKKILEPSKTNITLLFYVDGVRQIGLPVEVGIESPHYRNDSDASGAFHFDKHKFLALMMILLSAIIVGILLFIFWIFMEIDCVRREFGTKLKWLLILSLVPLGYLFYFFIIKRRGVGTVKSMKQAPFRTNALLSFLFGLISTMIPLYMGVLSGIPAIILWIVDKNRPDDNERRGDELAKAGLVLGIIGISITILIVLLYFGFVFFMISMGLLNG